MAIHLRDQAQCTTGGIWNDKTKKCDFLFGQTVSQTQPGLQPGSQIVVTSPTGATAPSPYADNGFFAPGWYTKPLGILLILGTLFVGYKLITRGKKTA